MASIHSHLPPKSGCICQHIPRFALSRRRATALFRNPVCKAQRSVPGFSSTPNSACRRYATSPPSAVASPHRPPSPIGLPQRRNTPRCENRRRAVSYVSTGLACLPRDANASPIYRRRAVVYVIPRFANNFYNRSSAVDSLLLQPTPGRQANLGLHLSNRPSAVASPIKKPALINGLRQRRNAEKTAEERFHMLARGWLAYPVTSMHSQLPPKSGCRNVIPRFANLMTPTQTQLPCE